MATVQASHAVGLPCVRPSPAATAAVATAASGTPCGCSAAWSLGHLHAWGHGREHSRLHARRRRRADPAEGGDGGGVAQPSLGSAAEEGTLPLHQPGTPPPLAMTGRERQRAAEAAGQGQGRGKRPPPQPPPLVVAAGTAWSADVTKLRSRAAASKRKDKELFARIKDDRRLDARFHELHESAFSCIDCLECANCCKTTSPRVLGKDVDRLARFLRMRPADSTMMQRSATPFCAHRGGQDLPMHGRGWRLRFPADTVPVPRTRQQVLCVRFKTVGMCVVPRNRPAARLERAAGDARKRGGVPCRCRHRRAAARRVWRRRQQERREEEVTTVAGILKKLHAEWRRLH